MSTPAVYREEQKFTQVWLWALIVLPAVLVWYVFFQQIIQGVKAGNNPGPDWLIWLIWVLIGIGLPVLFAVINLVTEVRRDHVLLRFRPVYTRRVLFTDIATVDECTYRPILEYGGWGIRWNIGVVAYTIAGNKGVMLALHTGKRILIGSQSPEKLAAAIKRTAGSSICIHP